MTMSGDSKGDASDATKIDVKPDFDADTDKEKLAAT